MAKSNFFRFILLSVVALLLVTPIFAQNITVSGHLYEQGSLESLPGGLIYDPVSQKATTTNAVILPGSIRMLTPNNACVPFG